MTISRELLIQINNLKGNSFSEIQISYSKKNRIKNLEAHLLNSSGKIIRAIKKKDIVDRNYISDENSYNDYYIKEFTLLHNDFPYFISYSYEEDYDEFIYEKWMASPYNVYTRTAELSLEIPQEYPLKTTQHLADTFFSEVTESASIRHKWIFREVNKIPQESYGPPWREESPSVTIVPESFVYGYEGKSNSWQAYGDWVYSLGADCNDFNTDQIEAIKASVSGIEDKKEMVKVLYNHLQDEMRYVNVTLDIGGMKPFPASYVAQNKYGDCKALTYYMKSMLEIFDIASYPVDVYWSPRPIKIKEDIYSQQFNHVFLCVPLEGDTVWLENTSKTLPFNYVDTDKQGEKGLLISQSKSQLITLPKAALEELKNETHVDLHLMEDNLLTGNFRAIYRGNDFETLGYIRKNWNWADQDRWIKNNFQIKSTELKNWKLILQDRNQTHIELEGDFEVAGQIKRFGPNLVLMLPPSNLPDLESPDQRKTELRFRVPLYHLDTLIFHLNSATYSEVILPAAKEMKTNFGAYSLRYERMGEDKLRCIRMTKIYSNTYACGRPYEQFIRFIESIKEIERQSYIQMKI